MEELRKRLAGRLHIADIKALAFKAEDERNLEMFEALFGFIFDEDKRVAENAAWVLTHCRQKGTRRLCQHQDAVIEKVLNAESSTMQRLLLSLLLKQPFGKERIRTDFLDFCLSTIISSKHPVAVRVLCCYLSYKQCCHFPELMNELETTLHLLESEQLTSGLSHSKKKVLAYIAKHKKQKEWTIRQSSTSFIPKTTN